MSEEWQTQYVKDENHALFGSCFVLKSHVMQFDEYIKIEISWKCVLFWTNIIIPAWTNFKVKPCPFINIHTWELDTIYPSQGIYLISMTLIRLVLLRYHVYTLFVTISHKAPLIMNINEVKIIVAKNMCM